MRRGGTMDTCMRRICIAAAVAMLAACGSKSSSTPAPLTLTGTIDSGSVPTVDNGVKANGTNLVTIQVSGGMQAPLRLTTGRGVFLGGARSFEINGTSATVKLVVCDARTDTGCAGPTTITAS